MSNRQRIGLVMATTFGANESTQNALPEICRLQRPREMILMNAASVSFGIANEAGFRVATNSAERLKRRQRLQRVASAAL